MRILQTSVVCLVLLWIARPLIPAQDEVDIQAQIAGAIERYGSRDLERAWQGARVLEGFGDDAISSCRSLLLKGTPVQRLMAAKALISLGATQKVGKTLREMAEDDEIEVTERAAAVRLLVNFPDSDTIKLLREFLEGEERFQADLRIQAARNLFKVRKDPVARESLMPLINVDDPNVRMKAALALGEMGYVEARCHAILQSLASEPTPEGAQARLILENELLMRRLLSEPGAVSSNTEQNRLIEQLEREITQKEEEIRELRRKFDRSEKQPLISNLLDRIERLYADPSRVNRRDLLIAAAKGMVSSLDPFSSFMDAKDTSEFYEGISGEYAGIGAQVAKDLEDDTLLILRPIYQGPAYKAGLLTGDKITEVEGISTIDVPLSEVVKKLKGAPGTPVRIMVQRRGWSEPREFQVTRQIIHLESVLSRMLPGQVGYLRLVQFGDTAVEEVIAKLDLLETDGMRALIFDLRSNPGGYLQAAVEIVDEFVDNDEMPIVSQKGGSPSWQPTERFATPGKRPDYPIVVLVNGASASASEIVSGALQDFGRVSVVGTRTFGKGSVQRLLTMPPDINELLGGETTLRLTVQYYYLPSNRSIHAKRDARGRVIEEGGVEPDVVVERDNPPLWRWESVRKLADTQAFETYLDEHYDENRELFSRLAEYGDGKKTDVYPNFDEFFGARNKDRALPEDIRRELRLRIRTKVQDERGQEFVCDFAEDKQLQRAILLALEKIGENADAIKEYRVFAQRFDGEGEKKNN